MASGFDAKRSFAVPFCSQSALGAICKHKAKHGLPENHKVCIAERNKRVPGRCKHVYVWSPVSRSKSNHLAGCCSASVVHQLSVLAGRLVQQRWSFHRFFWQFHSSKPSSYTRPWTLVAYAGEVHPGNMLNMSSRKTWCLYVSFLQFGRLLSRSDMWFCLCTIRSTEVSLLQAGFSSVFRLILEGLFGNWLPSTGVLLTSQKGSLKVFFCLGMLLQDGSAHKTVWANRQDSGSKPCF